MQALTTVPNRHSDPYDRQPFVRARRGPRALAAAVELSAATIEAIAARVAQLINSQPDQPAVLMDAQQIAGHFGLSRAWVYEHAQELGAIQLGTGTRPRLRFDLATVTETLRTRHTARSAVPQSAPSAAPQSASLPASRDVQWPQRRPPRARKPTTPLLPIGGSRGARYACAPVFGEQR